MSGPAPPWEPTGRPDGGNGDGKFRRVPPPAAPTAGDAEGTSDSVGLGEEAGFGICRGWESARGRETASAEPAADGGVGGVGA